MIKIYTVLACLIIMAIVSLSSSDENEGKLSLKSDIKINYFRPVNPPLLREEELSYYFLGDTCFVFPSTEVVGTFEIVNISSDTLKLAPSGKYFLENLKLEYCYPGAKEIRGIANVRFKANSNVFLSFGELPISAKKSLLKPGETIKIEVIYEWAEISKLSPGNVKMRWVLDNSDYLERREDILPVKYQSNFFLFKIKSLDDRIDSLYFLDLQAQNNNINRNFHEALDNCNEILSIDSTQLNAYRFAADVLWKANRFDEAIVYAEKGIEMLNYRLRIGDCTIYEYPDHYLNVMRDFIDKCQRREKWK